LAASPPDAPGERPGIDTFDAGNSASYEDLLQCALGTPIAWGTASLLDHYTSSLDGTRFRILIVHTAIAHVGDGEDHQLASVGGVGEDLLIAREARVEYHLPHHRARMAEGPSLEYGPVGQG